ncbi:MAG: DUF975 family protein [Oscillospiraceae bacterium]|nr:DUF975 family protein [Oscillospiraceae bacterium]
MDRAQLKSQAKSQIKGNIGILFLIMLIMAAVGGLGNVIPVVGQLAVVIVITPAFALASTKIFLRLTEGKKPELGDLFTEFSNFWASFKVTFLTGLFVFLWSLLLYIPGIIKAMSYSQAMYILAENPGIGAREAIDRSKAMMEGHKMELFVLYLSFIGWYLLGAITFGIAYIYILPYVQATLTNFYNSIKPVEAAAEAPIVEG